MLEEIFERLGNGMPAVRQKAREDLAAATTWRDLDVLRFRAKGEWNTLARPVLQERIEQLEDDLALNPPPISLDVEGGSLSDVATALSKATGCRFDAWPPPDRPEQYKTNHLYTVHLREAPFWDVFSALSVQHGMFFSGLDDQRLWLNDQGGDRWNDPVCVGPLAFFPQAPRADRWNSPAPAGDGLRFFYAVPIDPRVRIVAVSQIMFSEAKDNVGTDLLAEKGEDRMQPFHLENSFNCTGSVHFKAAAPGAKRMTVKGSLRVIIPVGEQSVEIPNAATKVGTTVRVADQEVKLAQLEEAANRLSIQLRLERPTDNVPLNVNLINGEGTTFWASTTNGKVLRGGLGLNPPAKAPITVRVAVPRKNREVTLPFEFKDLPLPQ